MSSAPLPWAALLSLAESQLCVSHNDVPNFNFNEYLEELRKHISLYPNDTNFLIKTEPGVGFGYVICLETDCDRVVVPLVARIDLPDGGLRRGYGSLASYRAHVSNNFTAHNRSGRHRGSLITPKMEPLPPLLPSNLRQTSAPNTDGVDPRIFSGFWASEPELSSVSFEPTSPRKRPFEAEDENDQKRVKIEASEAFLPSNAAPSSSSWSRNSHDDYSADNINVTMMPKIESNISTTRRIFIREQQRARETTRDPWREGSFRTSLEDLETVRSAFRRSLSVSTDIPESMPSIPVASTVNQVTVFHHAGASISPMHLNFPLNYEFMDTEPSGIPMGVMPSPYAVSTEGINQFFLTAGNAAFFDGEATVEESLASLGLKDLFTALPGMRVPLMSHQVLSLDWMLRQEKKRGMRGGCLADEMGLGKTVQLIALMVKNRSMNYKRKTNLIIAPLALLDQWQLEIETKTDCGFSCYIHHGQGRLKSMLEIEKYDVILTTYHTLASEWPDPEADRRAARLRRNQDGFVVEDERSRNKLAKKKELGLLHQVNWYRIILDEAHLIRNRKAQTSRVVVDMGDAETYRWCLTGTPIVNQLADAFSLLRFLRIRPWYDWKEFNDHIALKERKNPNLATSRLQAIFRTMLLRRKKETMLGGRRLIELLPKHIDLVRLEFSQEERAIYKMVETKSQATFNKFLKQGTVLKNYNHVFEMLLRLRQICSHPFLITEQSAEEGGLAGRKITDPSSEYDRALRILGPTFVTKVVAKLRELLMENMIAERQAADAAVLGEECPVCFEIPTECVVTECTHSFCEECIVNVLNTPAPEDADSRLKYKASERPCPVCRAPVSREKLFARKPFETAALDSCELDVDSKAKSNRDDEYQDVVIFSSKDTGAAATPPTMSEDEISTKMKHTMFLLKTWKEQNPDEKVVIISQWTRYLEIMSKYLISERFGHVKYQGSMSRKERNRAVQAFMTNEDTTVMLMSLKCGGVGLNLTRANRVISLDLSWSSAVETQSFDRVHRLGQQRNVFVQRLVIADTVEDRILALQDRKKALSESSLGEGSGKKLGRLSVRELANLFGLDHRGRVL